MGQTLGKAGFCASSKPFINLSAAAVRKLFQSFQLSSDGWSLSPALFAAICGTISGDVAIEDVSAAANALFTSLDTDKNDIIDGLEALATLAMVSSMTPLEKMNFVFMCYDFDESGELTLDEMTLSLKSTVTGLCKISSIPIPTLADFELIAKLAFQAVDKPVDETISSKEFLSYISTNPTAASWVSAYDDLEADEALVTTVADLTLTGNLASEVAGAKNFTPVKPPVKFESSAPFLTTLEAAKPPPPPPVPEGEDPPPPPKPESTAAPNSSLLIEWVHGYSGSGRNNAFYSASSSIVYPAATVAVVFSPADEENERPEPTQQFFADAVTDLSAITLSSSKSITACGTSTGTVYLFDASTAATTTVLESVLPPQTAVAHLAFSQDDQLLAVVGADADNSLVIVSTATNTVLFTAKTGKSPVLGAAFSASNVDTLTIVSAGTNGVKPIVFYVKSKDVANTWAPKKGVFGSTAPCPLTCVASVGSKAMECVVTGTLSGDLLVWDGRNLKLTVPGAAAGAITCVNYSNGVLAVGSEDGMVKTFSISTSLVVAEVATIDLRATGNIFLVADTAVSSVCLHADKILVGTRGNELLELSLVGTPAEEGAEEGAPLPFPQIGDVLNGGPITSCHGTFDGVALTCLASNAASTEFATVGTDMKLFVWDAVSHKQVKSLSLDSPASCVTYSSDGGLIAVGYSDGPKKGTVSVFAPGAEDPTKLELKGSGNEGLGQAAITTVKFGPSYLAAATDSGAIYLYGLEANAETLAFPLTTKLEASATASAIYHMDVSASGLEIVANLEDDVVYFQKPTEPEDAVFGLCTPFFNTEEKPGPEFATFSTPLYAGLQGIYGDNGSGSYTSVAKPKSVETVVAAADSNGVISLFPFPTSDFGAAGRSTFAGHSAGGGGLSSVAFTNEDAILLSAGTGDGCIFQWSFGPDEGYDSAIEAEIEAANQPPAEEEEVEEEEEEGFVKIEVDSCDDEDLAEKLDIDVEEFVSSAPSYEATDTFNAVLMPADAAGVIASRDLPSQDLSLKRIHGVSAQSTRNSVVYNDDGEIVYPAGAVCVVLNKAAGTQSHFLGHTDAVTCLTLGPDKKIAASGQIGTSPKVIVWDSITKQAKNTFTLPSTSYGISAVAFSADGSLLAVASQDAGHTIYVYSWKDGALKCQAKTGEGKILCLAFNDTGKQLVAGGVKTFSVVSISGKNMSVKDGQFGSALGGRKVVTCACWAGGDFVLGTAAGKLYRLEGGRKLAGETEVFEKGHINCLTALEPPADPEASGYPAVVVAGEFGAVKILDEALGELKAFDLRTLCPTSKSKVVRSACLNKDSRKLLVATKGSEIYEFSNPAGGEEEEEPKDINNGALIVGHSSDQLWGCAAHPVKNEVATCGDDKLVSLWDLDSNKVVRSIDVGDFARSCDYAPNGHLLAVGLGGVRNGGAIGSYEAPVFETKEEAEETEVGLGEEKKEAEEAEVIPTDPWLKTLYALGVKPREKEGSVLVLSLLEDEVRIVCANQDAAGYISDVKFSPDGNLLAAGSMDGNIYFYNCLKDFVLVGKTEGSSGLPVCHVDWSADSAFVMATNMRKNDAEVKFYSATEFSEVDADEEGVINASWDTWTSTLGKTTKGCFPNGGKDLSVVNSVCRNSGSNLVACGDVTGSLKIMKYPSLETGAAFKDFSAHSAAGGVSKVVFSKSDSYVASIGAGDRCLCVWDVLVDEDEDEADKEYGLSDDSDYVVMAPVEVEESTVGSDEVQGSEEEKKDDGAAVELTWTEKLSGREGGFDTLDYEVQACYGVSPKAGFGYNVAGDAVYSCGGASVIYRGSEQKFTVFSGSDGGVKALVVSLDGRFGLVGDANGGVKIFDTSTGGKVISLADGVSGGSGIAAVAFSADGKMCATVGSDTDRSLTVYSSPSGSWADGVTYAKSSNVSAAVSFVCFTEGAADGPHLVTGGFNHAMFWTLKGGNISSKKGKFGSEGSVQPLTCGTSVGAGKIVTGGVGGSLMEWDVATCTVARKIIAHTKCVTSVSSVAGGGCVTSGKDGFVKVFNDQLMNVSSFDVGGVCLGAGVDGKTTKLLAGMSSGGVKEVVVDSGYVGLLIDGAKGVWSKGDEGVRALGQGGRQSCAAGFDGGVLGGGGDGVVRKWTTGGGALPAGSFDCGAAVGTVAVGGNGICAVGLGSGVTDDSDVRTVEGTVLFLDVATMEGKGKAQKSTDGGYPTCSVFGSDSLCYVGMSGGSVQVFDGEKGSYEFTVNEDIGSKVVSVDVSVDGGLVAIGGEGGQMKFFTPKGEEKSLEDGDAAEWVNGSFIYSAKYLGVGAGGVSAVRGGLVGTAGGAVCVGGGDVWAHSGAVEGVGAGGGMFYTSSGADNGVMVWGQK
ncbi:hypothetical protein TrST_g10520 [Triparma strigata]|uniref:EF-hand domain-containing protein n=1 Tax=Triparma strigata TaxID=1606541 RepID=A0A9W6ZLP6_9STRA|nr:hypothetical protein TrST_g10520 [Triparma strigata]